jgi:DNA-binding NarL/FixJ family response regulator
MPLRVLVADDDKTFCGVVRRTLGASVKVIAETAAGEDAVRLAVELRPDVVLMDIAIPGLDAIAATRQIKADLPAVRVVMLTVHDEEAYLSATGKAGADAFLPKRHVKSELLSTIRDVVGPSWAWRERERRLRRAAPREVPNWDGNERRGRRTA